MAELRDLQISSRLVVPVRLLSVRYSRAGGPGGQHVNKVETKVDLRLDLGGAVEVLGEERVTRIRTALENRLDGEGNLQVVSGEHRSQSQNLEAALARMEGLIREALRQRKKRKRTRPTAASHRRRLQEKRHRGEIKRRRGERPGPD